MKQYNHFLILGVLLLIFPLLGFSELLENIYVIIIGLIISLKVLFLKKNQSSPSKEDLEDFEILGVKRMARELRSRMQDQKKKNHHKKQNLSAAITKHSRYEED